MVIKNVQWKNVKSYGNKQQQIVFSDENYGLILLTGTNGAGKTSIQESIDFCLFNQVRGKNSAKIPLTTLPNRINKNLEVSVDFYNYNNDFIQINRKLLPNDLSVKINNQDYTERYKLFNETQREDLIGFNYQTFKSFISLSMNDFLNFIHLKPEDKRNLLNRLFNLEEIDGYYNICKELITQNIKEIENITIEIVNTEKELKGYLEIIKNNTVKNDISKEELKTKLLDAKSKYDLKKSELTEIKNKISTFSVNIQEYRNKINAIESDNIYKRSQLNELKSKIKIYESGKCPYCNTDLINDQHILSLEEFRNKEEEFSNLIINNVNIIESYKEEMFSLSKQLKILESSNELLTSEQQELLTEFKILKNKYENFIEEDQQLIKDLKSKGSKLLNIKKEKTERINNIKKEQTSLIDLSEVLGDDGIRKNIISSIIPPINKILNELLSYINFTYSVSLNNNFDAEILERGEIINSETLSTGEQRMLNICIAISYIKMVRKIKNINIIFMDEVFTSVHKDNINLLLKLLKDFSKENNIHLILMHQGLEEFDNSIFDRIIRVEKNMFSDLIFE